MADRAKKKARQERRKSARNFRKAVHVFDVDESDLLIYGVIDEWDVNAKDVNADLVALGSKDPINVRINSGGGSVFEGFAIYNMLALHNAKINILIEGAALSIASVIAMAGDHIAMCENALFMVHDPSSGSWGGADDMRKQADMLDKVAGQIKTTYAARTGLSEDVVGELMSDETWMTADEALEHGFIDEVIDAKKTVARFDPKKYDVPEAFLSIVAGANVEGIELSSKQDDHNQNGAWIHHRSYVEMAWLFPYPEFL